MLAVKPNKKKLTRVTRAVCRVRKNVTAICQLVTLDLSVYTEGYGIVYNIKMSWEICTADHVTIIGNEAKLKGYNNFKVFLVHIDNAHCDCSLYTIITIGMNVICNYYPLNILLFKLKLNLN